MNKQSNLKPKRLHIYEMILYIYDLPLKSMGNFVPWLLPCIIQAELELPIAFMIIHAKICRNENPRWLTGNAQPPS